MTRNLTPEARRRGGRNSNRNVCPGCGGYCPPGETCSWCEACDAIESTPRDVDVAHLRRFAGVAS